MILRGGLKITCCYQTRLRAIQERQHITSWSKIIVLLNTFPSIYMVSPPLPNENIGFGKKHYFFKEIFFFIAFFTKILKVGDLECWNYWRIVHNQQLCWTYWPVVRSNLLKKSAPVHVNNGNVSITSQPMRTEHRLLKQSFSTWSELCSASTKNVLNCSKKFNNCSGVFSVVPNNFRRQYIVLNGTKLY